MFWPRGRLQRRTNRQHLDIQAGKDAHVGEDANALLKIVRRLGAPDRWETCLNRAAEGPPTEDDDDV